MTKQRLARLENAVREFGGRPCTLCWGHPIAAVEVVLEPNPDGPGCRRASKTLAEQDRERVTDDLRCRQCGKAAKVTLLVTTVATSPEEEGV